MECWHKHHKTMVLLGVEDEEELIKWEMALGEVPFCSFIESDIGNQKTAIAVSPIVDQSLFRRLKLL